MNDFSELSIACFKKGIDIRLSLQGHSKSQKLIIEAHREDKIIENQIVQKNESVEKAAKKMYRKLRSDSVIE